ncbi:MAG: HDOD domain-containing protein [Woeseiaceae bacterium]|nr:HDOD domain-containing protein [Woeseiaceae bacterium]
MSQEAYFNFAKSLARDLNRDEISLPSFPDVVIRIRAALDDADTTSSDLATIISVDAALTLRILVLANSTFYNPAGIKIEGLDAAIGRIGFQKVRSTAIAYAVEQLHSSKDLEPLKKELRETWSLGLRVAALSEAIAKHCTKLDTDSAFIAGLLNRIGVLWIFTKYPEYPELVADPESRQMLIDEWAAPIGESIVSNWNFSKEIRETLNPAQSAGEERTIDANLVDVVTTARESMNGGEIHFPQSDAVRRLNVTDEIVPEILTTYQSKLDSLASSVR